MGARRPSRSSCARTRRSSSSATASTGSAASRGDEYLLVVDGEAWPDPCSRCAAATACAGRRASSTPAAFEWSDDGWDGVALDELVLYELHVGTFSEEGTFDGVIPRLRGLRELGVTAIELMPVATFPGERGWGYDGLYTYAPHPAYGGPDGLARLVDAAHAEGLGVILDVVYNHVGPGNEALTRVRAVLHRPARDVLGRRDRLRAARRARVGDPERRAVGARLPRRRAAARRRARDLRRLAAAHLRRARRARARR